MFHHFNLISIILIAVTVFLSYKGFKDRNFFNKNTFDIRAIRSNKEYYRFLSSGFLHVDAMHLIFNMVSLYFFSDSLFISFISLPVYLFIYFGAILTGNFLAYFFHKNDLSYTAVGASGGVSGVIYAMIVLFPHSRIGLFILPGLNIPAWLFGISYLIYSVYGMKNQWGNVGHSAHIGGAAFGLLIPLFLFPGLILQNGLYSIIILLPLLYLIFDQRKKM